MAHVILNDRQVDFLEEVIVRFGAMVSYDQVAELVPCRSDAAKRRFVSQLTRAGWLVRIKKGFYQVAADLGARGTLTLSTYAIAQYLLPGSYVSFAGALQFHGLYDPLLQTTASVALKQRATVTLHGFDYRFVKTGAPFFFGFEEHRLAGHPARIATVEKALIDWVQFSRSAYRAVPVLEILSEYGHAVDYPRLSDYLLRANVTTQRIFGLLLERLQLPYDPGLVDSARRSRAGSRLSASAQAYSARWRLHYDPVLFDNVLYR